MRPGGLQFRFGNIITEHPVTVNRKLLEFLSIQHKLNGFRFVCPRDKPGHIHRTGVFFTGQRAVDGYLRVYIIGIIENFP